MEQISQQTDSATFCAQCPLNKKLYDQDVEYRQKADLAVQRTGEEIEQSSVGSSLYGKTPSFVSEIAQNTDTAEIQEEVWRCSRIRRIGTCSVTKMLFPNQRYL